MSLLLCLFFSFAVSLSTQRSTAQNAVRLDVPLVKQPYNLCLAASVSMVLAYWGIEMSTEVIADRVPIYKEGTTGKDLLLVVQEAGLRGFLIQPSFEDLLHHLEGKRPLIVVLPAAGNSRHALVLVGFDMADKVVWLNDPATGAARTLRFESFLEQWQAARRWTFLIAPE